ncbi:hypothetical protein KIH41_04380 [Litoribacter ruber]|uniref:Carboxypeptidase regulatory-like domain-containing protein n=1 Tax=Litoribacter ruber TaxID=702568 RepID=A0AAP2CIL5_9BACT|nr:MULTISPECIES: hypothetical protein [Litoribacter]MBS9525423.1 hypothetical protein [Litoribacter alkaliphilus]MBT0810510.1 hypothetical protein [Litoribacter ruber]
MSYPLRILIFIVLFGSGSSIAFAQAVTGNVIDVQDNYNLKDVKVENIKTAETFTSNDRGYFRIGATLGDSIRFTKEGYVPHYWVVDDLEHQLIPLIFDAVGLPPAYVFGERPSLYIPGISKDLDPDRKPAGPGRVYGGHSGSQTEMTPGFTMDGPISYFTRRERNKRQYRRAMEKEARQAPYLEIIKSDSVMHVLKSKYQLEDKELDSLIIEFNLYHIEHEFLDLDHEDVSRLLHAFFERYYYFGRK